MSSESTICPNCQQTISTNFERHILFCERNISLCPKCKQPIQKTALEEHLAAEHEEIECPNCYALVDSYFMERHQAEICPNRKIGTCPYCDIDLFLHSPENHVEQCGNRTDVCDICGGRIRLRDKEAHFLSDCRSHVIVTPPPEPTRTPPPQSDMAHFPSHIQPSDAPPLVGPQMKKETEPSPRDEMEELFKTTAETMCNTFTALLEQKKKEDQATQRNTSELSSSGYSITDGSGKVVSINL
ncbi:hypothetical protein BLNAU_21773 [Blattamonas nauphoetae]|uniref:TRAF-type domain-containing protein n=1 Tax=Blattamonas nauphoetae TaxID=2049346 RepID=A0ABQ9WUW6_9EUKA|nr:hypothetical protein BLNAU_21773 [Blattamonas nauphoetae]